MFTREYEIKKGDTKALEDIRLALHLNYVSSFDTKETEYRVEGTNYSLKEHNAEWAVFEEGNFIGSCVSDKAFLEHLKSLGISSKLIPMRSIIINQVTYSTETSKVEFENTSINENGNLKTSVKVICSSNSSEELDELDRVISEILYHEDIKPFFIGSLSLFERLKELDKKKQNLRRIVNESDGLERPMVITVSGTPRAGKTTCIESLYEFLKKADLRTVKLDEPAGLVYETLKNKEEKNELLKDRVGFVDKQYAIGSSAIDSYLNDSDVILCDRGILDTFIWYDMYYRNNMMSPERYQEFLKRMQNEVGYYNYFCSLYTDPIVSMQRDYINSLSIEPRTTMNLENIKRYNAALERVEKLLRPSIDGYTRIDTTDLGRMDASILVVEDVMEKVQMLCRRK